ncbi:hypothetical protein KGA66_27660 [Actinocrinis puniceicyclus]|uniref:Uncharacterized protein n=1 Tax=Actinocrinis puniceicyclus TaxID=977794 RepID=A0A8J7WSL6_9ACTN|nr:hypothetical protein [Actinocrinis puniceicyclus]MBS2966843.1 hypothetical protein [Actinocrinis puniceicyclus]
MAGPVITVAFTEPVGEKAMGALGTHLRSLADANFEYTRPGHWALNLQPQQLGIAYSDGEGSRPFLVEASGPGNEDGQFFEDGRFIERDWGFLVPLLAFTAPPRSVPSPCATAGSTTRPPHC